MYACGNATQGKTVNTIITPFVLSRQKTLAATFTAKVNTALANNKLSSADLTASFGPCGILF
jgi:hypothetical protein